MRVYINNRPISPHLLIYRPQNSSLGSIWHRMTGIFLLLSVSFLLINLKCSLTFNFFNRVVYDNYYYIWTFIYLFLLLNFSYHFLNGLRHILWDFGFLLYVQNLSYLFFFIIFLSFMILIINSIYL
uniref:Succinate dehydrogenase cytochrome B560 subunit n=1 Tax=Eucheuma denticulatum TaxID=305493 RepID=A0A2H4QI66_9FLOR|nr:succinate dehydrogenase cytochrome B560 subunit [Eucheuma denticulatum]ATX68863.1 succinate dehydrogenase cytochrome B560 subunit [Eucheuma denticulatum]